MKTMLKVVAVVALMCAVAGTAFAAEKMEKAKKANAVMMAPGDIKWTDVPKMTGIRKAQQQPRACSQTRPSHFQ